MSEHEVEALVSKLSYKNRSYFRVLCLSCRIKVDHMEDKVAEDQFGSSLVLLEPPFYPPKSPTQSAGPRPEAHKLDFFGLQILMIF